MLPDHLAPGLSIIFCGTAAGTASARRGHYYAGPGNRFWQLLHDTGLTPHRLPPEDDYRMPTFGYGLTDLAKGVAGADKDIPASAYTPARLHTLIAHYKPKAVAFTSLTAAKIALGQRQAPGPHPNSPYPGLKIWTLPSPSGLARGHFSAAPWHALAAWHRTESPPT